jgi:uncharacterized protein YodC (DUF2158 family)
VKFTEHPVFKVGALVTLKGFAIKMLVESVGKSGLDHEIVYCVWYTDIGELQRAGFNKALLVLVDE